ncbi:hypothetical protein ACOI1C_10745 [Bacillus sp. DJP31]|uniref:hypothetical protein n=1 Tax=Bacillus sp. DJP31 TaxID=3409789 RepID=UPI003BB704F3
MAKIINGKSKPLDKPPKLLFEESDFETYINSDSVYVDKTMFIRKVVGKWSESHSYSKTTKIF